MIFGGIFFSQCPSDVLATVVLWIFANRKSIRQIAKYLHIRYSSNNILFDAPLVVIASQQKYS